MINKIRVLGAWGILVAVFLLVCTHFLFFTHDLTGDLWIGLILMVILSIPGWVMWANERKIKFLLWALMFTVVAGARLLDILYQTYLIPFAWYSPLQVGVNTLANMIFVLLLCLLLWLRYREKRTTGWLVLAIVVTLLAADSLVRLVVDYFTRG